MEGFNPRSKQFNSISDLPPEKQADYVSFEGKYEEDDGFVKKEAIESKQLAELVAIMRAQKESAKDILHMEAKNYNEIRGKILARIKKHEKTHGIDDFYHIENFFGRSIDRINTGEAHQLNDLISEDRELLLAAGEIMPWRVMESASESIRSEKGFVKKLLESEKTLFGINNEAPFILYHAGDNLKDDEEIVKLAIERNPYSLALASERLRNNPEIVLLAVKGHPDILNSDAFFDNPEIENGKKFPLVGEEVRAKINRLLGRMDTSENKIEQKAA